MIRFKLDHAALMPLPTPARCRDTPMPSRHARHTLTAPWTEQNDPRDASAARGVGRWRKQLNEQ